MVFTLVDIGPCCCRSTCSLRVHVYEIFELTNLFLLAGVFMYVVLADFFHSSFIRQGIHVSM